MKKNKIVYVIFGIFSMVGIGLLIGGICSGIYFANFKSEAVKITGEITEIREAYDSDDGIEYQAYVSYSYDGKDYENVPLNSYSSSMYEGKEIELLCDPEHPGRVMVGSLGIILPAVLGGMGIIFTLVGIIPLIVMMRKKKKQKEVLERGYVIQATVTDIQQNRNYSVNGRHPYVIYCSYKDMGQDVTYKFKSENLWTDPTGVLPPGSTVGVYVMPNDYSRYYVDAQRVLEQKVVDYT